MKYLNINLDKDSLNSLPQTPGVYLFMNGNVPLYIGKSVNLKARVNSHYQNKKLDIKEKKVWENTKSIKYTTTDSDFKALLLESKLIKKHKPVYNIILKDDKSYLYIKIDISESYPKPRLIRGSDLHQVSAKANVFGPFPSKEVAEEILRSIRTLIPFCMSKNIGSRPCFYSKIGLCNPCPNKINKLEKSNIEVAKKLRKTYKSQIRQLIKILKGNTDPVITQLKAKMDKLSSKQLYEDALITRKKIEKFESWITNHSFSDNRILKFDQSENRENELFQILRKYFPHLNKLERIECYDASTLLFDNSTCSMVVATKGKLDKSQYRRFKIKNPRANSDFAMLKEALYRRLKNNWPMPDLIIMDGGKPQVRAAREILGKQKLDIPLIGIAKAPDRLIIGVKYLPTIKPDIHNQGFNLIRLLRDESHRFAKTYHKKLREKLVNL